MKTSKLILLAGLAVLAMACKKDSVPYITVPESIVLIPDESTVTFTVSSNVDWTMTVSDPWFKITPKKGKGETTVTVSADRNATGAGRNSTLEFAYAGGTPTRIPVSQAAYSVNMTVEAPPSVVVKKGEQLTLAINANTEDWSYAVTDGEWLKEASMAAKSLVFDLDPSVRFSKDVPAKIAFTSPSDPLFNHQVSILPVDFCKFSATAPESVEVETGKQLTVAVTSNIEDWTYKVIDGGWLSEASKTETEIVFDLVPGNLLDPDVKARLEFSSPSYANFAETIEIQPVSKQTVVYLADKSKMKALLLENDGVLATANSGSEYLFDGKWMTTKGGWGAVDYKSWTIQTSTAQAAEGHGDSFTIDAGETIRLAKFVSYHYWNYTNNSPLQYEIYAYTGDGEPQPDWSAWRLLGKVDVSNLYEFHKNLASGDYSEYIANGDTLSIPENEAIDARYYRFKMLLNGYAHGKAEVDQYWSGRIHYLSLSEASLYGYK